MPDVIQQRCWNHAGREAACRCPGCGRGFCRECVTEHASRLVCSVCLARLTAPRTVARGRLHAAWPVLLLLSGIGLGWLLFFLTGEALLSWRGHTSVPHAAATEKP